LSSVCTQVSQLVSALQILQLKSCMHFSFPMHATCPAYLYNFTSHIYDQVWKATLTVANMEQTRRHACWMGSEYQIWHCRITSDVQPASSSGCIAIECPLLSQNPKLYVQSCLQ
jgi:hypothetical protein